MCIFLRHKRKKVHRPNGAEKTMTFFALYVYEALLCNEKFD